MTSRLLALAAGLSLIALVGTPRTPGEVPIAHVLGCKPTAPIELELLSSDVIGGVAELGYLVRPGIESRDVVVSLALGPEAELLRHDAPNTLAIQVGEARRGSARVRLPQDWLTRGASLELRVSLTFDGLGTDGPTGEETQSLVRLVHFGAPFEAAEVEWVESGTMASLDMPAIRTEER